MAILLGGRIKDVGTTTEIDDIIRKLGLAQEVEARVAELIADEMTLRKRVPQLMQSGHENRSAGRKRARA